jgi:hypothetical protein
MKTPFLPTDNPCLPGHRELKDKAPICSDSRACGMDETSNTHDHIVTLTADIISAYVSSNHLQGAELPKLLADVFGALNEVAKGGKPVPRRRRRRSAARSATTSWSASRTESLTRPCAVT